MSVAVKLASRIARSTSRIAIDVRRCGHQLRLSGTLVAVVMSLAVASAGLGAEPSSGSSLAPEVGEWGYRVGQTGLWLGGFATLEGTVPQSSPASIGLGDVGLLVRYELTPSLAFFNETDLDDVVTLVEHSGLERGSRILLLERLYLDWSVKPEFTVRVGKFLTPFGIWNVIRRAPLTWTVDRPVATQSAFPEHTTGAQLIYQTTHHGWTLDATAYGQAQDELVRGAADTSGSAVGGGRMVAGHTLGAAYVAVGTSVAAFDNRDTERWEDAYGTDIDLSVWGNHLTGEFAYSRIREPNASDEWSFYLQDVQPLYRSLYGVGRFEHIEPRRGPVVNGMLIGIAWRPVAHVVFKADYQFADHEGSPLAPSALERGFAAGLTLFF